MSFSASGNFTVSNSEGCLETCSTCYFYFWFETVVICPNMLKYWPEYLEFAFGSYAILSKERITMSLIFKLQTPLHVLMFYSFSIWTRFSWVIPRGSNPNRHCRICHMCISEHLTVVRFPHFLQLANWRGISCSGWFQVSESTDDDSHVLTCMLTVLTKCELPGHTSGVTIEITGSSVSAGGLYLP